jgi:D-xylose transport system permease protein
MGEFHAMRRYYLLLLILWIHCGDLFTAWLYDAGNFPAASMLRPSRDATIIITAALCLLVCRLPRDMLIAIVLYGALALLHIPVGLAYGVSLPIIIGSFGSLMIPPLLFLVGYYCIRNAAELRRSASFIVLIALASTAFGVWDIGHTEFWTHTLRFPEYSAQVKGVLRKSTHPETALPWNFYMGTMENLQRRAAGLLAAPLAQGSFLAIAALLALAMNHRYLRDRAGLCLRLLLCAILLAGVWMSGTRGAMLMAGIALLGYALSARQLSGPPWVRLMLASVVLTGFLAASASLIIKTIFFLDGSSIGHWTALQKNLQDLPQVLLLGGGLGRQGAVAGTLFLSSLGGGEGAIFSIAFQIGVPGALVFLYFYGRAMLLALNGYRQHQETLGLAIFCLAVGMTITLVTSEHILSVSGSAALWLMLGGAVRAFGATDTRSAVTTTQPLR